MTTTRLNPATSSIAGHGKGWGFAVPNPGLSPVGSLGDAVSGVTAGVEVGDYRYITLYLSAATVFQVQASPGVEPGSKALEPFVALTNTKDAAGAYTAVPLEYTTSGAAAVTVPVDGVKIVRFNLTGSAADIRYTLHS